MNWCNDRKKENGDSDEEKVHQKMKHTQQNKQAMKTILASKIN